MSLRIEGLPELDAALQATSERLIASSTVAVQRAGDHTVQAIRASMGAPRWPHRGRSSIYSADVNGGGAPSPHGGPMGSMTGVYRESLKVQAERDGEGATGRVYLDTAPAGNIYKATRNERLHPTFKPATEGAGAALTAAATAEWSAAIA